MKLGARNLLQRGRLARPLLAAFFLIVAVLVGAGFLVTIQITARSLEARAATQLSHGEAIVYVDLGELQERLAFYTELLVDAEMLNAQLHDPRVTRSLMISVLGNLRRSGVHAHLYQEEPQDGAPGVDLVRKGFHGIRGSAFTMVRAGEGWGVNLESVAPIEGTDGVDRVVGVTFPLTRAYLTRLSRRTGTGITLFFTDHRISTLPEEDVQTLRERLGEPESDEVPGKPVLLDTESTTGPTRTRVTSFQSDASTTGRLAMTIPMSDLMAAKRNIILKGLLVTTIILSASTLLYVSLIRRVTRPLRRLSGATQDIAAGNLDLRVPVTTRDEVGDLAASFNVMVRRLRESRREIEQWNRTLEGRVADRTRSLERAQRELENANAQLVQAVQELRETQEQMIQAEKLAAVGQMASTMAHEIKNPLAGIRAALEVVAPELAEGPYDGVVKQILEQVDRLGNSTTQLLTFARPSEPQMVPTRLEELIETAHFLVERQAERQKVEIRMELDPQDRSILLDPQLTSQAFLNIMLNALQAMDGTPGTLTIRSCWLDDEGAVSVSFEDTGEGMTAEVRERAFAPFYTTKRHGTGLGLYAVKDIVERQNGEVAVASTTGEGTVVTVRLPSLPQEPPAT